MRRALSLACAAAVALSTLAHTPAGRAAPDPGDGESTIRSDADGPVRIRHENGVATFVGAGSGTDIDHPGVGRGTPVAEAARAHLRRYGAALGADRPGTTLRQDAVTRSVAGHGIVRYHQEVDGLPVLGADVVVSLDADRDLAAMSGHLSAVRPVPDAQVSEARARRTAEDVVRRSAGGRPVATSAGRWILDPATSSTSSGVGQARGTWRFEVRSGPTVRRLVLVDDLTGAVLLDRDLLHAVDRVVCDRNNLSSAPQTCQSGFARTETSGASVVADVNDAFDHAGDTAALYADVAGLDLTDLIGASTTAGRKLASTVRVCDPSFPCPLANAFWDGVGVHYGEGFAAADDVVGHELTHGVIERTSGLLYWDQSGAINESLADIVGEIVDHRNASPGDVENDWRIGEDLPIGALRDAAAPESMGQPDRMTSSTWDADALYADGGGVHTNSGVGNRAFHLISQGGTFNGRTVAGIDAGDPTLAKSAALWLQVIATINAFTEYDDLALVLGQACTALVGAGRLVPADCVSVQEAVAATEMSLSPLSDPVVDPTRSCPTGSVKRVLADSETDPAGAGFLTAGTGWGALPGPMSMPASG